ncbi:hypothetical protein ES705_33140 [subsurface metagenome]
MTQLIGALCDNGKSIITLSDRMVSSGDMTITFEPDSPKYNSINEKCIILLAGTLLEPCLIEDIKEQGKNERDMRKLVEVCKQQFSDLKTKRIEEEILRPHGFESFGDFHEKSQRLHDGIIMQMNSLIDRHSLDLVMLLAGLDEGGAHLFMVSDPGAQACFDAVGFCCPGIGQRHTDPVFALYRYSVKISPKEALLITFEAKKRAEMAGGIGVTTDATLISKEGIKVILDETLQELEDIHNDQKKGPWQEWLKSRVGKLAIKTRPLGIT